jgi:hypothetical protein
VRVEAYGAFALVETRPRGTPGVLPRWLGWVAVAASPFLLVQAFGLGGVIANFGLALDLVGFLLLLIFVLASSVIGLRRAGAATATH